ncbi:putative allantoate permease [Nemania sp. FL0916]|nr:putative allantoate permease [Nemania sp. FL0916]
MHHEKQEIRHAPAEEESSIEFPQMVTLTSVENKALYRKIDWHIMPLMFAAFFLQFLDKANLGYANIMGLQEDLGLQGQQFSWLATSFFIAYTISEFPQGWLLQRYPPATVLGVNITLWGILVASTAACHNFAGVLIVRILQGAVEAVITPSLILITCQWYKRRESTPRYGIWFCGVGAGQIIGGLISYAAQHGSRTVPFSGWRIMFVAVGLFNLVIATLVLLLLPNAPDTAPWLSKEEKAHIRDRLALDRAGTGMKAFQKAALVEVFNDLHVWILFFLQTAIVIPSGVITTFSATLIAGFGFDSKTAALLNVPSGAVSIFAVLSATYAILIDFPRWLGIVLLMVPSLIGAGLMSFYSDGQGGVLAGIYLPNFSIAPSPLVNALAGTNTKGYTKKVAVNATLAIGVGIANIIGLQTFLSWEAPNYISAKIALFVANGSVIILAIILRVSYGWSNRKKHQKRRSEPIALSSESAIQYSSEQMDKTTDVKDKAFVYMY